MYFVYVLYSFKDKKFYIGYTENLEKRVSKHLLGKVAATKSSGSGHKYLNKQLKNFLVDIRK